MDKKYYLFGFACMDNTHANSVYDDGVCRLCGSEMRPATISYFEGHSFTYTFEKWATQNQIIMWLAKKRPMLFSRSQIADEGSVSRDSDSWLASAMPWGVVAAGMLSE